ncbi:hypothetical protein GTA51_19325 [Desulfovibrio aerotolerans]|uniref:Uncharacterized protein n=1 Tax=Solidesulfovibrio aerotolerans TaxID=295255 RepID=A0A7C9N4E0_9BACT|nr:hypothetical protein [Solidesulfovibrio aerotolerans]MYL85251.1 hypothetical protein [Solidesulfovibrio aerotolerans]
MRFDKRLSRRRCFELFKSLSNSLFEEVVANDRKHEERKKIFSFYIVPNGRWGGQNERVVDVFYGSRPFESVVERQDDESGMPHFRRRLLTESGGMITYNIDSYGLVFCILYPARTEDITPWEDFIILEKHIDPIFLTGTAILKRHWKILSSFSEVRCIDGDPSIVDFVRVYWVLFTKNVCIDGKLQGRRIVKASLQVLYISLTVGCSGFLLYLIQLLMK